MTGKRQVAEALAALPETLTIEETLERLYAAFKLKQAARGGAASLARLRQLVEEERIPEARELAAQIKDPKWSAALEPARVKVADRASGQGLATPPIHRDALAPYAGQWVAVRGGQIIGADFRRNDLRHRLAEQDLLAGSLFVKVDE